MPDSLTNVASVNIDDSTSVKELHHIMHLSRPLINFYLRYVVFPKEAKEFSYKLSSSAWDLCSGRESKITSGFSGTCDSLLPLTIRQKDLSDLRHTNAAVLAAMLRKANRVYICAATVNGQRLSAENLLKLIVMQNSSPSVIIDVGAQFLDDNIHIASSWLEMRPDKMAAIYFNDVDEKMILTRDGRKEQLTSSSFREQVVDCLIYLDEFHTRGTDFRLPDFFTAAVLLGPGLQKDACAQACLRVRKLNHTQSVIFIAPPEVDNSIREVLNLPPDHSIDSATVVKWTMYQSCLAVKRQRSQWVLRGMAQSQRRLAFNAHVNDNGEVQHNAAYLEKVRERESQPLSVIYGPLKRKSKGPPYTFARADRNDKIVDRLIQIWSNADSQTVEECGQDEEQEREVLHEVERVHELYRPVTARPSQPKICQELSHWIRNGPGASCPQGVKPPFDILHQTTLSKKAAALVWSSNIFVTEDYLQTVVMKQSNNGDDFIRPVQWLLGFHGHECLYIISPHEANEFLPMVRTSQFGVLILYSPRVTRTMSSFDGLNAYRMSGATEHIEFGPSVTVVLRLFAGQLYFNNFEEHQGFCDFLGLWDGIRELEEDSREVAGDGFVSPACRRANGWECNFATSPVQVIKGLTSMRRKGIEWSHTHVGRALSGLVLSREELD